MSNGAEHKLVMEVEIEIGNCKEADLPKLRADIKEALEKEFSIWGQFHTAIIQAKVTKITREDL